VAELPPAIGGWATGLRRRHYPPDRNCLDAHVTLFHALPPSSIGEVREALRRLAADCPPPVCRIDGVMGLGGGTAFKLVSPEILAIRDHLSQCFRGLLTSQDAHRPRLHITVQNKVSTKLARSLQVELESAFEPRDFAFSALGLYHYCGGPWEAAGRWSFRGRKGS
jgi:hypothetical protein